MRRSAFLAWTVKWRESALCRIEEERVVVLVIAVGHRSDVYRLPYS